MSLGKEQLRKLYVNLIRTRAFDQLFMKRMAEGRLLGFYHPAEGGEAPGVGTCTFLRKDDIIYPHHRGHGLPHIISKGADPKYYLAEHTGKATGSCGGISTFHNFDAEHGILGYAGTLGSGFALSVGWGLAAKKNGCGQVVVCCFGDGTSNRGTFHEAALMAANWNLPIVWVCENNGLAVFMSVESAHPVEDIASLAQGYGMPAVVVDGQDVVAVAEAVTVAVGRAREGKGPSMVECKCLRFCSHALGIPDLVGCEPRSEEEIDGLRKRDPIKLCRDMLIKQGFLTPEDAERIDRQAANEVREAEQFADESPRAEPSCLETALYAD